MEISNSRAAARFLRASIRESDAEEFWSIALDPLCRIIAAKMLFRGTVDSCLVHPRDIFRFACMANATSVLVGHNHPSGVCEPSAQDHKFSEQLRRAGEIMQIPVVDHVIITDDDHFSFADKCWRDRFSAPGVSFPRA